MISWAFAVWTVFAGVAALLFYQRLFYPYFWEDLMYCLKVRKVGKATMAKMKRGVLTYLDRFVDQAEQSPEKPFIIFEQEVLTYMDVHLRSNKFANVFRSEAGVKHGDTVALWMSNEPDFLCAWFGLSKLGCEVAFLNSNIKSRSLQHCLQSCGAKFLIVGSGTIIATLNVYGLDSVLGQIFRTSCQSDKLPGCTQKLIYSAPHYVGYYYLEHFYTVGSIRNHLGVSCNLPRSTLSSE